MKETVVKIDKIKSWFFEKINKIDMPLARFIKKKKKKTKTRRIKSTKLEIKRNRLQKKKMEKCQALQETSINNYMAIK